jgi:serine/threonine-protein kinase
MKDALQSFLIALVTSVAVLFGLGPVMMQLNGSEGDRATVPVPPATASPTPQTAAPSPSAAPATPNVSTAPNVEGMLVRDARERWRDQGILIIEDGTRLDSTEKAGTILEQTPRAGVVLGQKELRVIVAIEAELVDVPNVVGRKIEEAKEQLEEAGLEVPDAATEPSTEKAGTVLSQEPDPGTKTEKGAEVRLKISAELIEVPKLRNKRLSQARKELEKLGLALGKVSEREDEELSGGRVLSQSPARGSTVEPGTTVDLVVVAPD